MPLDIDECGDNSNACQAHALCENTYGSYDCNCVTGFSEDGEQCIGKLSITQSSVLSYLLHVDQYYP